MFLSLRTLYKSSRVLARWWGASYTIMVLVSFLSSSRILARSFLSPFSEGRKASKQNLLVESPDMVRAVIHAAGPGREVTWIPAS